MRQRRRSLTIFAHLPSFDGSLLFCLLLSKQRKIPSPAAGSSEKARTSSAAKIEGERQKDKAKTRGDGRATGSQCFASLHRNDRIARRVEREEGAVAASQRYKTQHHYYYTVLTAT